MKKILSIAGVVIFVILVIFAITVYNRALNKAVIWSEAAALKSNELSTANQTIAVLNERVRSLSSEIVTLQEKVAQQNNDKYIYEGAARSIQTVNFIALYHTLIPNVMLMVTGFCGSGLIVILPFMWMAWMYAYKRYYLPAIKKYGSD